MWGNRTGQRFTRVAVRPRHGDQVLHRRVGPDLALTHPLLDKDWELLDQGQPCADPALAMPKLAAQRAQLQPEAAV